LIPRAFRNIDLQNSRDFSYMKLFCVDLYSLVVLRMFQTSDYVIGFVYFSVQEKIVNLLSILQNPRAVEVSCTSTARLVVMIGDAVLNFYLASAYARFRSRTVSSLLRS